MTKPRKQFIFYLPASIFILDILIKRLIRPIYGQSKYGVLSDILGWLPNFLGAFGFMAFGLVVIKLREDPANEPRSWVRKGSELAGVALVCLAGFIMHEVKQKGTRLYYDVNDIYATIGGTMAGALLFIKSATSLRTENMENSISKRPAPDAGNVD